jgi:hypothetical protein
LDALGLDEPGAVSRPVFGSRAARGQNQAFYRRQSAGLTQVFAHPLRVQLQAFSRLA